MKNFELKIITDTNCKTIKVNSIEDLKNTLKSEYDWTQIYRVHTHYAELYELDKDGERDGSDPIAHLQLLEHDDFSSEDMEEEDGDEISSLYQRLGQENWDNDYDNSIADFCENIVVAQGQEL